MSTPSGWRGDSAAVFALTIPVDSETAMLAESRRYADHPLVISHQAYEHNVAVPRLLDVLDDVAIAATFYVPGYTLEHYPGIGESILGRGHELAHHSYGHRKPVDMSPDEERRDFERALATLERLGVTPTGHRAAYWSPSVHTLSMVAEYGLLYDSSLMHDDRPYIVDTSHGEVVELPPHWAMDDWEQYAYLPDPDLGSNIEAPGRVLALWRSELDGMRRHGGLFQLTVHAFLSGRPGRAVALHRLLEYAASCGDVEFSTSRQLAKRARADATLPHRRAEGLVVDAETYPVE